MKLPIAFPLLSIPSPQDAADAASYWCDKEWKTWAVDVTAGTGRRRVYGRTFYARARTSEDAAACVKRNLITRPPRHAVFRARLAGPRELGCVPTPGFPAVRTARGY